MQREQRQQRQPMVDLLACGQSFWLDNIRREWLHDGTLARMVRDDGLRGLTSNPAIFFNAITSSALYRDQIQTLAAAGASTQTIYEALVISDIQMAADVLAPVHAASSGEDGYVSLEVSPLLAHDAAGTIDEARRLFASVARPNVMIKVPGTPAGLQAIRALTADGVPINVTLLFSTAQYEGAARAFIDGLRDRLAAGQPVRGIASVASVFLSRIDTLIDQQLSHRITPGRAHPSGVEPASLLGQAAVASCKRTYAAFERLFGPDFDDLRAAGALAQRPLWASTSTKNPLYSDVMYVEPLVGPQTVNTMPDATVKAYIAHGQPTPDAIRADLPAALNALDALARVGIDLDQACQFLQDDGVEKFIVPFRKLLSAIEAQRLAAQPALTTAQHLEPGPLGGALRALLAPLEEARVMERLWAADPTLWGQDPARVAAIRQRLGWLRLPDALPAWLPDVTAFAQEVQAEGTRHVLLLGMGGSSLSPEVADAILASPARADAPKLLILDTTHPDAIQAALSQIDPAKALVVVASKSGTTIETACLFDALRAHFEAALGRPWPSRFVAVTDPDTLLARQAQDLGLRRCFLNPPDIGGRFSALSLFGAVPMALIGVDVAALAARAKAFAEAAGPASPAERNPALQLGALLAVAHAQGRDKLTLYAPPALAPFGDWLEQLVAESTGKQGLGILPVVGEQPLPDAPPPADRVFVCYHLDGGEPLPSHLSAATKQAPTVHIHLKAPEDLAQEFLRWELATAVAGVVMQINPFDEPDVRIAKDFTQAQLSAFAEGGAFPDAPCAVASGSDLPATASALRALLQEAPSYAALMAYLPMNPASAAALAALRAQAQRLRPGLATATGFGPRLLHSIGQLYKGGAAGGVFVSFVHTPRHTLAIPSQPYTFNTLLRAQALGDLHALHARQRPALLIDLGDADPAAALQQLADAL
jgi:transaldolase/glucose-6-phosphate isomerase